MAKRKQKFARHTRIKKKGTWQSRPFLEMLDDCQWCMLRDGCKATITKQGTDAPLGDRGQTRLCTLWCSIYSGKEVVEMRKEKAVELGLYEEPEYVDQD